MQMLVEIAAAEKVVVIATVGARQSLGRREPVGRDAGPDEGERCFGLAADMVIACMPGDEPERVEVRAVIGGACILGDSVAGRMVEPVPPRLLACPRSLGVAEPPEGEQVPGLHQMDVGVAGLHGMPLDGDEGVAMDRVERVAGGGRQRVGGGEPQQARELHGELDRVGIGDGRIAEPPAEVAELAARWIEILHRAGQPERLLDRLRVPAIASRLEGESQQATDAGQVPVEGGDPLDHVDHLHRQPVTGGLVGGHGLGAGR